jgi:hypothetical protein
MAALTQQPLISMEIYKKNKMRHQYAGNLKKKKKNATSSFL